jgi:hypothetical protein
MPKKRGSGKPPPLFHPKPLKNGKANINLLIFWFFKTLE